MCRPQTTRWRFCKGKCDRVCSERTPQSSCRAVSSQLSYAFKGQGVVYRDASSPPLPSPPPFPLSPAPAAVVIKQPGWRPVQTLLRAHESQTSSVCTSTFVTCRGSFFPHRPCIPHMFSSSSLFPDVLRVDLFVVKLSTHAGHTTAGCNVVFILHMSALIHTFHSQ